MQCQSVVFCVFDQMRYNLFKIVRHEQQFVERGAFWRVRQQWIHATFYPVAFSNKNLDEKTRSTDLRSFFKYHFYALTMGLIKSSEV